MASNHYFKRGAKEPCQDAIISDIKRIVVEVTGFKWFRLKGENRNRHVVAARMLLCFFVKERFPRMPLVQIGKMINRDHTTVMHAIDTVMEKLAVEDPIFLNYYNRIKACLPDDAGKAKIPVIHIKTFRKVEIPEPVKPVEQYRRPDAVYSNRNFWE